MKNLMFTLITVFIFIFSANAATHIVTSPADTGIGTLRKAVTNAINGDTIIINYFQGDSIKLNSGQLTIGIELHIFGKGKDSTVISGDNVSRIFKVSNTGSLFLYDLTIADGYEVVVSFDGAGIYSNGNLFLRNCDINSCYTQSFDDTKAKGGAIYFESSGGKKLVLDHVNIFDNRAKAAGGGIYLKSFNNDTIIINKTMISNNSVEFSGGAIYAEMDNGNNSYFEATDFRINWNSGGSAGAIKLIISNNNKFIHSDGEIRGNSSNGSIQSVIDINTKSTATVLVERVSIAQNSVSSFIGGLAIFHIKAEHLSKVELKNSFITANYAWVGLLVNASSSAVVNSFENTLADQKIKFSDPGYNLKVEQGTLNIRNNLITNGPDSVHANNILPGNGSVISLGYNLISNDSAGIVTGQATDLIGTPGASIDPKIGRTQMNGGNVFTNALMCGSPAVDAGGPVFSGNLDVRGFNRLVGNAIDIGAYERQILTDTIPNADFYFTPDTICHFDLFSAFDQSSASLGSSYQWYRDSLPAGNSQIRLNSVILMQDSLPISLVVTTPACYTDSVTKYIYTPKFSPLPLQIPSLIQVCQTGSAVIALNPTDSAYLYQLVAFQGIVNNNKYLGNNGTLNLNTGPLNTPAKIRVVMESIKYGCTKALDDTIQINILDVNIPSISRDGDTLFATMQNAINFQWYLYGNLIAGATGDKLVMTNNGTYQVFGINNLGCTGASNKLEVFNVGIDPAQLSYFKIFPNPATDIINIKTNKISGPVTIRIIDNLGRTIAKEERSNSGGILQIDISSLTPGVYTVSLIHEIVSANYSISIVR